jgi:hypothetical protein
VEAGHSEVEALLPWSLPYRSQVVAHTSCAGQLTHARTPMCRSSSFPLLRASGEAATASTVFEGGRSGSDAAGASDGVVGVSGRCEPDAPQHAFRGVSAAYGGKWKASVFYNGCTLHLGTYATPEAAARAHDAKALELLGPRAKLNFQPWRRKRQPSLLRQPARARVAVASTSMMPGGRACSTRPTRRCAIKSA